MKNCLLKHWAAIVGILACCGFWAMLSVESNGQTDGTTKPSFSESFSSGFTKLGQSMTPKPVKPTDDPVSLQTKGKAGVELYVAVARLYEESGRLEEAEQQYKRALKDAPNDLRVQLGYARLKDRMGNFKESLAMYQQAAQLHPQDPSAFNNLAVHYARHSMLREALGAMERAAQLRPKEAKYRNNMATLLVEMGKPQEAFTQLRTVYDEAVAHYNLGFLLNKKGQPEAASREFAAALRANPTMVSAQQWLNQLNNAPSTFPAAQMAQRSPPAEPQVVAQTPVQQSPPVVMNFAPPTNGFSQSVDRPPPAEVRSPPPSVAAVREPAGIARPAPYDPGYGVSIPVQQEPRVAANPQRSYAPAPPSNSDGPMPRIVDNTMPSGPELGMPDQRRAEPSREVARQPAVRVLPPPPVRIAMPTDPTSDGRIQESPPLVIPQIRSDAPALRRLPPVSNSPAIEPEPPFMR